MSDSPIPFVPDARWLDVATRYGTVLRASNDLRSMTSFILLEREAWFEDELDFLIGSTEPGFHVADIGANAGVFSTALARAAGPAGRIVAFEPNPRAREILSHNAERAVGAPISIDPRAVGEERAERGFHAAADSEVSGLADGGAIRVETVSLDAAMESLGWTRLDVVKIDVEGAESAVLRGARATLARHSPLVMLELQHGEGEASPALNALPELGLMPYRLIPGIGALMPLDPRRTRGLLNAFAVSRRTAETWGARGYLIDAVDASPGAGDDALTYAGSLAPARASPSLAEAWRRADAAYLRALGDLLAARRPGIAARARAAWLERAVGGLSDAVQARGSPARRASFVTALADAGEWTAARTVTQGLLDDLTSGADFHPDEPLVPPVPRFEGIWRDGAAADWLKASICAFCLERYHYSTRFMAPQALAIAGILGQTGYLDGPSARRRHLCARYERQALPPSDAVLANTLNPELWRAAAAL